jgi:hypothetical protein
MKDPCLPTYAVYQFELLINTLQAKYPQHFGGVVIH